MAQRVLLLQKRVVRSTCEEPYSVLGLALFVELDTICDTITVHRRVFTDGEDKSNTFTENMEVHSYGTRQKKNGNTAQVTSSLAKDGPKYMFGNSFYKILADTKYTDDLVKFKIEFKNYLLNRPYYSIQEYLNQH